MGLGCACLISFLLLVSPWSFEMALEVQVAGCTQGSSIVSWGMMEPWKEKQERGLSGRQQAQPFPSCRYQGPSFQDCHCSLSPLPESKAAGFSYQAGLKLIFPRSWV